MNIIQSSVFFVQVIHRALRTTPEPPDEKPLCLVYKWTLVYCIAHFSSIWKWNDALSRLVCLFVLSSADNGRRRRIAREPGSFRRDESPGIISGAKKGKRDHVKETSSVTDKILIPVKNTHLFGRVWLQCLYSNLRATFWINSESRGYYFVRECIVEKKRFFFLNKGQNRRRMWLLPNAVLLIS